MLCFTGTEPVVFAIATTGCDSFRARAHLARCACAILRREADDMIRPPWFAGGTVPESFSDSMTEIAWSMFSTPPALACAQHEAAGAHQLGFPLFPPRYLTTANIV